MSAPIPRFVGRTERGKVRLASPRDCETWVRSLGEGVTVDVSVRVHKSQRSLDQNAYIHAVPVPIMAEHWGCTIEETKLLLMGECWGWNDVLGHRLPVKPHTSSMNTQEASHFIEWCQVWAMTEFHVEIPLPNECDWEAA